MWLRKIDCIGPMRVLVNSNGCIWLLLLRTKDLCSFMVKVVSAKFICPGHAKTCYLNNARITNALSTALSGPEFEFFSARAHASDATLKILIVGHYLKECSNVIIHCSNVQVTPLVSRGLKPLVVDSLS